MRAGLPQVSVLPLLCTTCIQMMHSNTPGVYLALFADDTFLYATDRKQGLIVRKLQRGLSSMEIWSGHWNIKTNEDKTQGIYFFCI
jgi:hypothetical protein